MKLYIESDAFAEQRFEDLREELDGSELGNVKVVAAGFLSLFWQGTQSSGLVAGTREQIADMIPVAKPKRDAAFEMLFRCRYISKREDGLFEVRGNQKHVEALRYFQECGRKGGLKSQGNKKEKDDDAAPSNTGAGVENGKGFADPPPTPPHKIPTPPRSIDGPPLPKSEADQIGSDQINSDPIRSTKEPGGDRPAEKPSTQLALVKPDKKAPAKAAAPAGTNRVIARFHECWGARWKAKLHLSGKEVGQLGCLCRDQGEASAIKLVEAYLEMPDAWFVTKRHSVGTLMENLSVVSHYMQTGKVVTRRDVKNLDSAVATQNLLDSVERGEI
jgi:hypothetical protein